MDVTGNFPSDSSSPLYIILQLFMCTIHYNMADSIITDSNDKRENRRACWIQAKSCVSCSSGAGRSDMKHAK